MENIEFWLGDGVHHWCIGSCWLLEGLGFAEPLRLKAFACKHYSISVMTRNRYPHSRVHFVLVFRDEGKDHALHFIAVLFDTYGF
jgi:hypothetical protein